MKNSSEVVTVAVVTYHSEKTVIETLDSILCQSYGANNIELIISDDGSNDGTVAIVEEWLLRFGQYFNKILLLKNESNSGVSINCNRAWRSATSKWIKTIAGDDFLLPNCIVDNVSFISDDVNNEVAVVFSRMQSFKTDKNQNKIYMSVLPLGCELFFFELNSLEQFYYLQRKGLTGAPSAFMNFEKLSAIGFADERFKMIEDYPLWFNMTASGYKLHFMNKVTIGYRIGDSISRSQTRLVNELFINEIINIDRMLVNPTLGKSDFILILRKRIWSYLTLKLSSVFNNKSVVFSRSVLFMINLVKPGYFSYQLCKLKSKLF